MQGIYRISIQYNINIGEDKKLVEVCYIGKSKDINKRLKTHITMLNNNTHYNKILQKAYNQPLAIRVNNILETCNKCTELQLQNLESYYIEIYKMECNGVICSNISD